MSNRPKINRSWVLFIIAGLFGVCAASLWLLVGEPSEYLSDNTHYMALYEGRFAPSPFGYRVLTPFLSHLLPWGAGTNFCLVTIGCLVLITGIIALYTVSSGAAPPLTVTACTFWVTSFPFVYYTTAWVRADGPMLLLLAAVFLLSRRQVSAFTLSALIMLGTLSHETMLLCIPALWIDKLLSGDLTGGRNYKYTHLLLITMGSLAFFMLFRLFFPALPAERSYLNGMTGMFSVALEYSGGWIKHFLRIYASYGPALLFAAFFAAPWRSLRRSIGFFILFSLAVSATFLATDTLRVMAIIYFPVIYYAAEYLHGLWRSGSRVTAVICLLLQIFYSFIVYGHLRSFESSVLLNRLAAVFSVAALIACLVVERKRNERIDSKGRKQPQKTPLKGKAL